METRKQSTAGILSRGLAAAAWLFAAGAGAAPAPRAVCDEPVWDFGEATAPAVVEHDYELRNDGELTLLVENVRASCGCTAVNASQEAIPPGGTGTIHASFNTANRRGDQIKTITVTCNDPAQPTLLLTLRGRVVDPLRANPTALYFGRLTDASSTRREVTLVADEPFQILAMATSSPHFRLERVGGNGPETTHAIAIEILPTMPRGVFSDTLTVDSTLPSKTRLMVPLTGDWAVPEASAP